MDYEKDFVEGFVKTSKGSIRFLRHTGVGKKLLFLHGLGGSTVSWKKFFSVIPKDYDVTAIDLLGHGGSDAPEICYSVTMQAQVLDEVLNSWDWKGYIVGHSYGGWVAATYAARVKKPEGLVLIDSLGIDKIFKDMIALGVEEQNKDVLFDRVMLINSNKNHVIRSIVYDDHESEWLRAETFEGFACKTLIIWGSDDVEINESYGKYLLEIIPGSRFVCIEGAGHSPFFTNSEECWKLITDFIWLPTYAIK